jgi:hypothetical protein
MYITLLKKLFLRAFLVLLILIESYNIIQLLALDNSE